MRLRPEDLPLAIKVAQLFCLAIPSNDPILCEQACDDLRTHAWGGYIFDRRRDERTLLEALIAAAPIPLLIASDVEMGAGQHLVEASSVPHAMAFGATDRPEYAYELGRLTALEARHAGVNWVLAPIADVNSNPDNPIINVRSFGSDPERVGAFVRAFVRGCEDHGAMACAKHFPGHGDTAEDSHSRLATAHASPERMRHLEWTPFRAAIEAKVSSVMSAHVAAPHLDPTGLPATLSARMLAGILRAELGFEGLIVSDALIMGGVTEYFNDGEAAVSALKAGCDVLLMPPNPRRALACVLAAVQSGELDEDRINQAFARVSAHKERVLAPRELPDASTLKQEGEKLAREVAERSLTLVRGDRASLEVEKAFALILDDDEDPEAYAVWKHELYRHGAAHPRVVTRPLLPAEADALLASLASEQRVLCAVFSTVKAWKGRIDLAPEHVGLLNRIRDAGHPVHAVSFSNPYVARQLPRADAFLCAYSDHPASQRAALAAFAGELQPVGRLPVQLDARPGHPAFDASQ